MASLSRAATLLITLNILCGFALGAVSSEAGGALKGLSIASFGGSGTNTIQAVATDAHGNIYVAGTTSSPDFPVKNATQPVFGDTRILRTTDLGATWTQVGSPPQDVNVVVPDPLYTQVLLAAGNTGIYKSTDGGRTWALVYPFPAGTSFYGALAMDPGNHLRLAALLPSGAFIRTMDGGATWTTRAICQTESCGGQLWADPVGSGAIIAGLASGLSLSRDWGATFQELQSPGPRRATAAAFDPSHPGWIYAAGIISNILSLSTDYGVTWTPKTPPPSADLFGFGEIEVDPHQSNTLVAWTDGGLYVSFDGAASWTQPNAGVGVGFGWGGFAFANRQCAPGGGVFALGGAGLGVAFSPDDGATWTAPQFTNVTSITVGPACTAYVTRPSTTDAFVAKLASDGTVVWSTFLGGFDKDAPVAMAVDGQGDVYVTGDTTSPDFPTTVPRIGPAGPSSVFVTKYSTDGTLLFSATIGGESVNHASAIAVDLNQNVYVGGQTTSLRFPVTLGALSTAPAASFLVKLSPNATLVYSTYLGTASGYLGAILVDTNNQVFAAGTDLVPGSVAPLASYLQLAIKVDAAASQIMSWAVIPYGQPPSALAMDAAGNVLVFGQAAFGPYTTTPGAYSSPQSPAACALGQIVAQMGSGAYLTKLDPASLQPIFRALLNAPCGISTGEMAVDAKGSIFLAFSTNAGLALRKPFMAGPAGSGGAIAALSADGSTLEFATYLDDFGIPAMAIGPGGLYVGVSDQAGGAGVLDLPMDGASAISIDGIANAFSGDASVVVAGGLYALTNSGFEPASTDLWINPSQHLPTELNGVQVLFDGVAAPIMDVEPGRVIVAAPANLGALTSIQIMYNGASSRPVWMPVSPYRPGLMRDFLDPQARSDYAEGFVQNEDGSLNDVDHPAAAGSTIRVFATGMGATIPPTDGGSVATSSTVTPVQPVFTTWQVYSSAGPVPPQVVYSVQGFLSSLFQIPIQVPSAFGNGASHRVEVGLGGVSPAAYQNPISNLIYVHVR